MIEVPKRLKPKPETMAKLYLQSGNVCAFPGCGAILMDLEGNFLGQLCHIEAAEPGGERFNPAMTNEERRSAANLLLMCYPHHRITNNTESYTVDYLQRMKARHEARFSNPDRAMLERVAKAKWATLVGGGLLVGSSLDKIVSAFRSLFATPGDKSPSSEGQSKRSELLERLRFAPTGVVHFYSRDPLHATVGAQVLEVFHAAGWSLQQVNESNIETTQGRHVPTESMLLIFEVEKSAQVSNTQNAIDGFFDAAGFLARSRNEPLERVEGDKRVTFIIAFASRK